MMISPKELQQKGLLPIQKGPLRFAVGSSNGLTSNAWRIWVSKKGDAYISCRDNFREAKVSLHASGRWRLGFTSEAISENPTLVPDGENRAWDVWDRPPETIPDTVRAFELVFPTPELAVRPDQRIPKDWKKVIFIEAAPPGKVAVVTLFVTRGRIELSHESEPSFWLACLDLGNGYYAQLVAHGDDEGDLPATIGERVADARTTAERSGVTLPADAYVYFFGKRASGVRYIFGARLDR